MQLQKFVSTTIRPTSFSFPELIGSWENISAFVADFIEYVPLENPTELVSQRSFVCVIKRFVHLSILIVFIEISMMIISIVNVQSNIERVY